MIRHMTYFRLKRLTLGRIYERFLEETLSSGGTIFLVECGLAWPTVRISERHIFQHGALGGATVEEFYRGGPSRGQLPGALWLKQAALGLARARRREPGGGGPLPDPVGLTPADYGGERHPVLGVPQALPHHRLALLRAPG
jgi:hypothetical protein